MLLITVNMINYNILLDTFYSFLPYIKHNVVLCYMINNHQLYFNLQYYFVSHSNYISYLATIFATKKLLLVCMMGHYKP